jgi:hypothetical protein
MNEFLLRQTGKVYSPIFCVIITLLPCLINISALSQEKALQPASMPENQVIAITNSDTARLWFLSASVFYNFIPGGDDYLWPVFTADHDWLHLEGRYNYEDLRTASAWIGYNFDGSKKIIYSITPMLGGVLGKTKGIGLGAEIILNYKKIDFYSESEYIFHIPESEGNFFYTWSELSYSPLRWFRLGFALQHTKVYKTNAELQRGILAGFSWKRAELSGYAFDPDKSERVYVIGLNVDF